MEISCPFVEYKVGVFLFEGILERKSSNRISERNCLKTVYNVRKERMMM
jgi:hypothetical protein